MLQPIQITFHGLDHSDAVEARIRQRAAALDRLDRSLTSCKVRVEARHERHRQGNLYSVHVELHLPGHTIVASRDRHDEHAHEDVYVAIRDAFDAAERKLEEVVRARRGETKHHAEPVRAQVVRLHTDLGYGFARLDDGTDVYFHASAVKPGVGRARASTLRELAVGDPVRVVLSELPGTAGPQASAVVPTGLRPEA